MIDINNGLGLLIYYSDEGDVIERNINDFKELFNKGGITEDMIIHFFGLSKNDKCYLNLMYCLLDNDIISMKEYGIFDIEI